MLGHVGHPLPQYGGGTALEGVTAQLDLPAQHAPEVKQHTAHTVEAGGVLAAPFIVLRAEGVLGGRGGEGSGVGWHG